MMGCASYLDDDGGPEAAGDGGEAAQDLRSGWRVLTGRFCRSCSEVMRYCGACVTSGYCSPDSKLSQNVGAIWPLPDSVSNRSLAISC